VRAVHRPAGCVSQEREVSGAGGGGRVNRPRYQADGNQAAIVRDLRAVGCSVQIIEGANGTAGVPDLLVGRRGSNYLLEVKRPKAKGQRAGRLSAEQREWHLAWRGQSEVVSNTAEAYAAVGLLL